MRARFLRLPALAVLSLMVSASQARRRHETSGPPQSEPARTTVVQHWRVGMVMTAEGKRLPQRQRHGDDTHGLVRPTCSHLEKDVSPGVSVSYQSVEDAAGRWS